MSNLRTHYVTTTDGVTIAGTVHGQGPPIVFVQGGLGDGDIDWQALLPHLTGRFTCYLLSWRGRGLSGDHPDHSIGRRVDDILAYVGSIEAPTGLVGWSGGAILSLAAAAAEPGAVTAVVPFEPTMVLDEQEQAAFGDTLAGVGELAAEGRLAEAIRAFAGFLFNDEDVAVAEEVGYLDAAEHYIPAMLYDFQQASQSEGPDPADPAVLGAITAPVLVLYGSESKPWWARSARHVADHAPNATAAEIPGAGHAAPLTHPEALAATITEYFTR